MQRRQREGVRSHLVLSSCANSSGRLVAGEKFHFPGCRVKISKVSPGNLSRDPSGLCSV